MSNRVTQSQIAKIFQFIVDPLSYIYQLQIVEKAVVLSSISFCPITHLHKMPGTVRDSRALDLTSESLDDGRSSLADDIWDMRLTS